MLLPMHRFVTGEGVVLRHYDFATSLVLTSGHKECPDKVAKPWQGEIPVFGNMRWHGGKFAKRPRPYLKQGVSRVDADAAFRKQCDTDIKQSAQRKAQERR